MTVVVMIIVVIMTINITTTTEEKNMILQTHKSSPLQTAFPDQYSA